jgi:hypothetical protein
MTSLPSHVGDYAILSLLGVGGMGKVYLARERGGRQVALKVLLPELTEATLDRLRFEREFEISSRLTHEGLVRVFECHFKDDLCFYSMEFISGVDFSRAFQAGHSIESSTAIDLFAQLAEAVAYLHQQNIVHRDLKCENVLIDGHGKARLLDFGLACFHRTAPQAHRITTPGMVLGTPYCMAPEQILGEAADERTDLYSLGVMLYQVFCQRLPYDAPDVMAVLYQILNQPVPDFEARMPAPPGLAELVLQLLSKEPHQRPRDASEVALRLRSLGDRPLLSVQAQLRREPIRKLLAPRFVGRQAELAWLEPRLARLLQGQGAWAYFSGASGVGKSHLLQQFAAQAKAAAVTAVKVAPVNGSHIPYQLWTPVLRWALHGQPVPASVLPFVPVLSLLLPELGESTGLLHDPLQRYHLFEGMARLILSRCQTPTVLLFDQLHEADAASLEFLHYFLETRYYSAEGLHLPLLILASNSEEAEHEGLRNLARSQTLGQEFELPGFSPEESQQFLASCLDQQPLAADALRFLHQETEGKPLYLLELARQGVEGGAWIWQAEQWQFRSSSGGGSWSGSGARLPARMQKALRARLEGVEEPALEVLRLAAVLGPQLAFGHLLALSSLPERQLFELCTQLVDRRLLVEERDFQLFSEATREVVLESCEWKIRRLYHARAAEYLASQPQANLWEVAQHWMVAAQPRQAGQAYLQAASQALRSYAFEEACVSFTEISALPAQAQPLGSQELDELWSEALLGAGRPQEARQKLEPLGDLNDRLPTQIRRLRKLGTAYLYEGNLMAAHQTFQRALSLLNKLPKGAEGEAQSLVDEGNLLCEREARVLFLLRPQGWLENFTQLVVAQIKLAFKRHEKGSDRQATWAVAFLYGGFWSLRRLKWSKGARWSIQGALNQLDKLPDHPTKAQLLGDSGYILLLSGSTRKALRVARQGRDMLTRLGVATSLANLYIQLSAIYFYRGAIGAALEQARLSLAQARRTGNAFEEALALSESAKSCSVLGHHAEAAEHLENLAPLQKHFGSGYLDLVCELAQVYFLWGQKLWLELAERAALNFHRCIQNQELPHHTLHFGLIGLEARLTCEEGPVQGSEAATGISPESLRLLEELNERSRGQRLYRPIFKRLQAQSLWMQGQRGRAFEILGECTRRAEQADIAWERYRCHGLLALWLEEEGLGEHHRAQAARAWDDAQRPD